MIIALLGTLALFSGCAHTLHVRSNRVDVTLHNRGDAPIDCSVLLYAMNSVGETSHRIAHRRVKPGIENVVSLWADSDEHFIDAWRTVECEPTGPLTIPRWP